MARRLRAWRGGEAVPTCRSRGRARAKAPAPRTRTGTPAPPRRGLRPGLRRGPRLGTAWMDLRGNSYVIYIEIYFIELRQKSV